MLERLEDLYLNIFRYLLIIAASIALILGVINLFISLSKILDNPDEEEINFPVWSELKYDILPISQPKTQEEKTTPGTFEPEKKEIEIPPDHRIVKVLKNLDPNVLLLLLMQKKLKKINGKYLLMEEENLLE